MDLHVRQQFRDGIIAQLTAKCPSARTVMPARGHGPAPHEAPCVMVMTGRDTPGGQDPKGKIKTQNRQIQANILVYAQDLDDPDPQLNEISVEIERILEDHKAVHPKLESLLFAGAEVAIDQGQVVHGVIQLAFVGSFYVMAGAPDKPL